MPAIGNWITENSTTTGTGSVVVNGAVSSAFARFRDAIPAGTVYYSIEDGDSKEAGIGTFNGIDTIARTTVTATFRNLVYNDTTPSPLNLSGSQIVSCTLTATSYSDLLDTYTQAEVDAKDQALQNQLDLNITNKGLFISGASYVENDQVLDAGYLGIANTGTTDSPAPQLTGQQEHTIDQSLVFTSPSDNSVIKSVHQYTFTQDVIVDLFQVQVPFWDLDSVTRITVLNITQSTAKVTSNPVLKSGEWIVLGIGSNLFRAGDQVEVWLEYYNSSDVNAISGGWTSNIGTGIPVAQEFNIDNVSSPTVIEIDHTDLDSVGRATELDGVSVDSIINISETSDTNRSVEVKVVTIDTVSATSTKYTVTLIQNGASNIRDARTCTVNIDVPITQPSQYSTLVDHWATNQPSYATVASELYFDGVLQADVNDAYGIDFRAQPAYISADYLIVSTPSNGGAGNSSEKSDKDLTIRLSTATSESLLAVDRANAVECSNAAAITFTLPSDATLDLNIGHQSVIRQTGAGQVTFSPDAGVTIESEGGLLAMAAQYAVVTVYKSAANTYALTGSLV